MNVLLEAYQSRCLLQEVLNSPCLDSDGTPFSLLAHFMAALPTKATSEALMRLGAGSDLRTDANMIADFRGKGSPLPVMRELVSRWGLDVRTPYEEDGVQALALHAAASYGHLPLVEYFIEECGLFVDELAPEGLYTPLTYACCFSRVDDEMLLVQVVKYLLDNGADATLQTAEGRVAEKIAIASKLGEVYNLLVKHRRAQQAYRARKISATTEVVDAASFAAKQREAEEAAQALLAELDAEETYTDKKKSKKGKGGNGGKKKKDGDGNKQGPPQAERKEKKEEGDAGRKGEAVDDREGADTKSGQGQHGSQSKERDEDVMMAAVAAATGGMTLGEGKGDQDGAGTPHRPADEDYLGDAPDEFKCPITGRLLKKDVVPAMGTCTARRALKGGLPTARQGVSR